MGKIKISFKTVAILLTLFVSIFINKISVKANSATIDISSSKTQIETGEEISVDIVIKANKAIGGFEANLVYDDRILEYRSGSSIITGSSGYLKMSEMGMSSGTDTITYNMKFRALKTGTTNLEFQGKVMVYGLDDGMEMPVTSKALNISVIAPVAASSNAYLKSIKASPNGFKPQFSKEIYTYSTEVDYEVKDYIVSAIAEDENARVTIKGNENLIEGLNEIVIEVLAESGNKKQYKINLVKNKKVEEIPEEPENITDKLSLEIIREDGLLYANYNGKIQIIDLKDESIIPEGYAASKTKIGESTIITYNLQGDENSQFVLIYGLDQDGNKKFYQLDLQEHTLQRLPKEEVEIEEVDDGLVLEELELKYKKKVNRLILSIGLLLALCSVLAILFIKLYMDSKGYGDDF